MFQFISCKYVKMLMDMVYHTKTLLAAWHAGYWCLLCWFFLGIAYSFVKIKYLGRVRNKLGRSNIIAQYHTWALVSMRYCSYNYNIWQNLKISYSMLWSYSVAIKKQVMCITSTLLGLYFQKGKQNNRLRLIALLHLGKYLRLE